MHDGKYRESWDILQSSIDCIICVRFPETAVDISRFRDEHLRICEKLYPVKTFSSIEMVIKYAKCVSMTSIIDF